MKQTPFSLNIPTAIVAAGIIIAGAIVFDRNADFSGELDATAAGSIHQQAPQADVQARFDRAKLVTPVDETDHIRGNVEAPITLIEYSDLDCPACRSFHGSMIPLVEEFPNLRWVYRHYPLDSKHPNARYKAAVSECVAQLAGNDAFWSFVDGQFDNNVGRNVDVAAVASQFGIDAGQLEACATNADVVASVQADLDNGIATGGQGTPWSLIVLPSGEVLPLGGAYPYNVMRTIIEAIEKQEL